MAELWVEVLTVDEARRAPVVRLHNVSKEEYEIRLILWETRDVPLMDGKTVDIYNRIIFDPSGWGDSEITKETDVHYASSTGKGVFNWRFLFDISTPCEFPRLKFQLFCANIVSSDAAIGEATLNLKK